MKKRLIILFFSFFCYISYGQITPVEKAVKMIQTKDLDGDGVLCLFECSDDLLLNFKLIDLNSDNYISEKELVSYYTPKPEK